MNTSSLYLLEQLSRKKIKIKDEIDCTHCKNYSGYKSSEIRLFRGTANLRCKKCGLETININPPTEMQLLLEELQNKTLHV